MGYGLTGLNILKSLVSQGHHVSLWPIGQVECPQDCVDVIKEARFRAEHCYNKHAHSLRIWHQWDLAQHVGRGPHCGFPIFELDRFTEAERWQMGQQDLLFVASQWAKWTLVEAKIRDESFIEVAPLGVDHTIFHPFVARSFDFSKPEATVFLNVGKWEVRKGHDVLYKAFCKAFTPSDNVHLVMACYNPCKEKAYSDSWKRLYEGCALGKKITVIDGRLPNQESVAGLMASVDCGVFPSRAEGWNLELGEMMAMGKVAIATNNTAHTEYVTKENCLLIETPDMEIAYDGLWFHGQGGWAKFGNDQEDQLISHLRGVHAAKQGSNIAPTNQSGIETMKRFTWDNTAQKIVDQL